MNQAIRILIVEDEKIVAEDIKGTLLSLGYEIAGICRSGEETLEKMPALMPDLVLMDIILSDEMSGIEAANIIREKYDIPVIYLTSHADAATLEEAKTSQPYGFIVKPFEENELESSIQLSVYKHRMEKRVRESEAWFSATFRSIGDGLIVADIHQNITFINSYAKMLTGCSEAKSLGRSLGEIFKILDERSRKPLNFLFTQVLTTGQPVELIDTAVLQTADGREMPVDASLAPIKNAEGNLSGIVLVFHDTLDRKLTLEALRESEERYRSIFEESRDAIYIITRRGNFVIANQSMLDMFGYSSNEITEFKIEFLFAHSADWEKFQSDIENKGSVRDYLVEMRHKDGQYLDCQVTSTIREDDQGKILGYQGIIRDITTRNQAEKALRESEARYRILAENITEIIWTTDLDLVINYVTPSVKRILGYNPGDFIIAQREKLFPSPHNENMKHALSDLMNQYSQIFEEDKTSSSINVEINTSSGSTIWFDVTISLLMDESKNVIGTLSVAHDITKRKKAENEKDKMHAQLLQAQKMEAVGILAGGIAHDFNNLLTVIQGNTDLAMFHLEKNDPLYSDLEEVHKASQRAAELTSQLLLFSRKQPMRFISVNFNKIIEDLLKMLHRLIGEDVGISTYLAENLWTIDADKGNMEQVIMNLAVNARDAMPGGGQFSIRSENTVLADENCISMSEAVPGNYVLLSFIDTGIGIDQETLSHIFEPFFSTKGQGKGTGLGLSVVYGIVKQHNGWIHVQSNPGHGTAFKLYFPANQQTKENDSEKNVDLKSLAGNGKRILLVEDEEGVLQFGTKALSENGYNVFTASNAEEANYVFNQENGIFDLIVCDVVLPDKTGIEIVEGFRKKKQDISVLLCSGYTDQKSQWSVIQERGYGFLQKPYTMREFLISIKKTLNE